MALADRKEGDAEQLAKVFRFNEELEDYVYEFQRDIKSTVERLDIQKHAEIEGPINGGILNRILLTDSLGRHKRQRDAKRLGRDVEDIDATEVINEDRETTGLSYDIF